MPASTPLYLSHSYRDRHINGHFVPILKAEDVSVQADQKTGIWCVPKLERSMAQVSGVVSIIPIRPTEADPAAYSRHIALELALARRARVPRLLLVDERVLDRHHVDFPEDAIPYAVERLEEQKAEHIAAIKKFRTRFTAHHRTPSGHVRRTAVIVVDSAKGFRGLGEDLAELMRRKGYSSTVLTEKREGHGLDDIRLLEAIWRAEVGVYLMGPRISEVHVGLAMAHAHCLPAFRLLHDPKASSSEPSISGLIRWRDAANLMTAFKSQFDGYLVDLVDPAEKAQEIGYPDAFREIGTAKWVPEPDDFWNPSDGPALVRHVHSSDGFIVDEVAHVRRLFKRSFAQAVDRASADAVCRLLYDEMKRHQLVYEFEPVARRKGVQSIRSPSLIKLHANATCLDMSCLFAALLEGASQLPLIAVLKCRDRWHAVVGYRARNEPRWTAPDIGSLRRACTLGDAVLFEATGPIEADSPVAIETILERSDKKMSFSDAKETALRLLMDADTQLLYLIDVAHIRGAGN